MVRKLGGLIVAGLIFAPALAAEAPFCVVSQNGRQSCFYHSLGACRTAATAMNGACATNAGAQRSGLYDMNAAIPTTNILGAVREGQVHALETRKREEEIELLRAQREALQTNAPRIETNIGYWVMYQCPDGNGGMQPTGVPEPGCVVDFVTAY